MVPFSSDIYSPAESGSFKSAPDIKQRAISRERDMCFILSPANHREETTDRNNELDSTIRVVGRKRSNVSGVLLHARQERELASRILAALSCTEADDEDSGKKEQLDLPHLLGIVQMRGNLPAQKAAAEQVAQEVGGAFGGPDTFRQLQYCLVFVEWVWKCRH